MRDIRRREIIALIAGAEKRATSRVATSQSSIVGRRDNTIDFRSKRSSWWIAA